MSPSDSDRESPLAPAECSTDEVINEEETEEIEEEVPDATAEGGVRKVKRRRRKRAKLDSQELRLLGRRNMCKRIAEIAPRMLRLVKLKVLNAYIESKGGLSGKEDEDLTKIIQAECSTFADRKRVLREIASAGTDFARDELKRIILTVLLQEETHSSTEPRLFEIITAFESSLLKRAKQFNLSEIKKSDPERWHRLDTYRIVLEAAWSDDDTISADEARLLSVLRSHLHITMEEHWVIGARLKRFPKVDCALHTPDEVNDARKDLQRQALLWSFKNEDDQNTDVIPAEVAEVIRKYHAKLELQTINYRRLISHDAISGADLRAVLQRNEMDKSGNKPDLIDRIVSSDILPSAVLDELDKDKLSTICAGFGLRSSGAKGELIQRLIDFYDDLTFELRPETKDKREVWYSNYELLSRRAYAELHAKKMIEKDLEIEHQFEAATAFLFDRMLHVPCDMTRKDNKADGRLYLDDKQTLLLDCKSAESPVNLQDYLENQFDGYLRKERDRGRQPLGFLVIATSYTPNSLKLAYQYKAKTNWDISLITAEGLKHLAERWAAMEPEKPFPVRLLNTTGVIDKDRAEVILSLV